nr:MAG TPA: hypothetical protein [Caudoviricetes sp.]
MITVLDLIRRKKSPVKGLGGADGETRTLTPRGART